MKKEKGAGDRSFFRARKFPAQNAEALFSGKRLSPVGALFDERRSFSGAFCQDDLHSEALIFRRKGACYNTEGKTHSGKEGYL